MKIVIAGGTGFLGSPLAEVYAEEGHDVRVLTRGLPAGEARHEPGTGMPGVTRVGWRPAGPDDAAIAALSDVLNDADAVVNLAGTSLADKRWTAQRKAELRDSRIVPTRALATAILAAPKRPRVFISQSGVGYYGAVSTEIKTEDSPAGNDFVAHLAEDWEREAIPVASTSTRVIPLRTGMVIERSGGALAKMLLPFRFFAGGPMGSGHQYVSWIHRLDYIEMVRWIIDTPAVDGPVNATAPHPVTNREFARALGHALGRPSFMPAPGFALRILLGEMADALILSGQRVIPARAQAHGYHFRYPEIDIAMRGIFGE
jgi:uncharacterized protein (TIGR01777 family)